MAAGTITVSLHATLHNVSKIKNEICENNNRVNCEDRNLQQTLTNLPVKQQQQQQPPAVSKSMENILTQQQPSSTTNSAADSETTNATRTTKESSKSSSKKRARDGNGGTPELMRCKRRINFAQLGYNIPPAPPTSVARRNERERNRVKLVNMGFATLREHVPNGAKNKKMSKVDTLRSAVEYIRKLQQLLNDEDFDDDDDDDMNDILEEEDEEEENNSRGGESSGRSTMKSDGANSTGSSDVGSPYRDSNADSPQVFTENLPPTSHPLLGQHYHHLQNNHHHNHHHHHPNSISTNNHANNFTRIPNCPPASVSPICSVSSSPSPSQTSDYSSYEPLSPEEEDLLDFTSWFT